MDGKNGCYCRETFKSLIYCKNRVSAIDKISRIKKNA